jgi:TfoX/Sxy family transcriptional regulator of competence genes
MAYSEPLAERVRQALAGVADVREQKMFGGLAFMVGGNMTVGIVGEELMVRLGAEGADRALDEPQVRTMDFTGRPMSTMVLVEPAGVERDDALERWVSRAREFVATLPPKP